MEGRVRQSLRVAPVEALEMVKILAIDDQPEKLLSYEVALAQVGATLIKASSACEAFESLLRNEIGLILIDVCMPDVDGFELAALIREHPRFEQIAIIFVSAEMHADVHRLRGYELGAVDYIPVPVMPELLRAKVNVFLELYRKTRQLKRYSTELEERVLERTADLRHLQESLERQVEERTREREAALAQVLEAQQIDTIGQLAGVAHDFNNLLMAVLGNLTLLQRRVPDDSGYARLLHNATQGAKRGTALTSCLLAFARRRELTPQSINVRDLVSGMEELLKRALGLGIDLKFRFPRSLPCVFADANHLELALLNVALNARSAMPDGGTLTISASGETREDERTISTLLPGEYLRIQMIHAGGKMDDAKRPKLTESRFTPEGAGLTVVRAIATQLGGVMCIDNQSAARITLELCLPRADSRQPGRKLVDLGPSLGCDHP
jgi:DNA-binding response OmpR family regulator